MIKRYVTRNSAFKVITCFLTILLLFGLVMPVHNVVTASETNAVDDTNLTNESGDDLGATLGNLEESDDIVDVEDEANEDTDDISTPVEITEEEPVEQEVQGDEEKPQVVEKNGDDTDGLAEYFPSLIEAPITLPSYYFQKSIANLTNSELQDTIAVSKTAGRTKKDGKLTGCRTFEVTLKITGTPPEIPVDVVLILDRSGSMSRTSGSSIYNKIEYAPSTNGDYYVKINGSYQSVSYHNDSGTWRYGSSGNRRYVSWDINGDDIAVGNINSSTPTAKPFYVGGNSRLYHAKEAAINFAAKVLGPDGVPGSRVSVVSYSGPTSVWGNGYQDQASTNIGLTYDLASIVYAINALRADGGTNTQAGFLEGKKVIENSDNPNSNKVVIMFTDGVPTVSNGKQYEETTDPEHVHITTAIAAGESIFNEGVADVFTIGLLQNMSVAEENLARKVLDETQNKRFYEAPTAQDLDAIFQDISENLGYSAKNAIVVDKIGEDFNLIESSLPEGATYNSTTREITWKPGTIVKEAELKYIVQAKPEFEGGPADTNEYAKLTYTDIFGVNGKEKTFPVPEVDVPAKLTVSLADATIIIGESITLGTGKDSDGENYMSPITGGDGDGSNYTYEWKIKGSDQVFSNNKNPEVKPENDTIYELTVTDSNGCKAVAEMLVTVMKTVTIKKEVTGNFGDRTQEFSFTIAIKDGATKTFKLKHGETYTLNKLLHSDVITLSEEDSGHEVTVTVSGSPIQKNNDGTYTINVADLDNSMIITVTNDRNTTIGTGISLDSLPYIIILALVITGIAVVFIRKRRISNED